jgi:thymidylate synthase (FAD)
MKIIKASARIEFAVRDVYGQIESIGRTCYKSELKQTDFSAEPFVRMLRDRGHFSMFDHVSVSVRFIVDCGVSHELVRHRIAAYAQESTRYCNYGKEGEVTFIQPCFCQELLPQIEIFNVWKQACLNAEKAYLEMLAMKCSPEQARSVLPNSLKTEIVATLDFTSWRHVFKLRTSKRAHPQMREVMVPLLAEFTARWPACFDDIIAE